jgi:outer membrane putative beta-barrel porin/alpha-amylase
VRSPGARGALWLLLAALAAQGAAANPIRANTPGTGVFQRSGLLAGVVADDKAAGGTELLDLSSFAELRYTPHTHWVFAVRVPYRVESRLERRGAGDASASGPGDVVVSVKHRFYRWVGPWADRHAAVEIGLKLPTGATDRPLAPGLPVTLRHRLQPGTGSTDGLIDFVYQQARQRWVYAGDAGYRFNSEGDGGYREGDEARLNLSAQYVLLPRVYKQPGHEVFAVLEGTFLDAGRDRLRGAALAGTDRSALLLAPGLQYVATERLFLDLSVQFPLHEEIGRGELASRWNALFQLRWAF